jgi:hypothetical protein
MIKVLRFDASNDPNFEDIYVKRNSSSVSASIYLEAGEGNVTLIEFDVNRLPDNIEVVDAYLHLSSYMYSSNANINLHNITKPWTFDTSWSEISPNKGSLYASTNTDDHESDQTGSLQVKINIKNLVKDRVEGLITSGGIWLEGDSSKTATFYSSRYYQETKEPYVEIHYIEKPTKPIVTSPSSGDTWNKEHTITWNKSVGLYKQTVNIVEDFEDENYNFSLSGSWVRTSENCQSGTYSYKSADIYSDSLSRSSLLLNVEDNWTNPIISFYYKTSSETNYDELNVKLNGDVIISESGDSEWMYYE